MSGRGRASRGRGLRRQTPAQQATPAASTAATASMTSAGTRSATSTATTASMASVGTPTGLRRSQRIQNQAQQQATPAIAITPTTAPTSKGKQPKKQEVGRGKAPATTTTAPVATPSTSGTPATPGLGKRKRSEEVSPTDSGMSGPLAHTVPVDNKGIVQSPPTCGTRKVCELCKNFPSLIPPDAPALPEELAVLKGMGFHFVNVKPLGGGVYGTIYECKFIGPGKDGREMSKILACKRVAINQQLNITIREAENNIQLEVIICELLIENPHLNVTKHELIYRIRSSKTDLPYQNPINHLFFMEKCDGNLFDFVVQNFGYSTDQNYSGALTDFLNKIWVRHVCQGLDHLHNANKGKDKKSLSWVAIIHHDLKHANILYKMRKGCVKFLICDFGMSAYHPMTKTLDRNQPVLSTTLSGSDRFLSYEVWQMKQDFRNWQQNPVGTFQRTQYEARKKDVYAVGLTLHDCLIGFDQTDKYSLSNNWLDVLYDNQLDDYRNSPLFANVDPQCFDLMFQMLDSDASKRLLTQNVLTHPWLNDPRLAPSYVDVRSELPQAKTIGNP